MREIMAAAQSKVWTNEDFESSVDRPSNKSTRYEKQTKISQSNYNQNILQAMTSQNLSNADLAWHANKTYGWNCYEVNSTSEMIQNEYFTITCANGTKLRVYPRPGRHPIIKNQYGTYE